MKTVKFGCIVLSLILIPVLYVSAQSDVGTIAYMEEGVEIDRNSETIPSWDVFIGMGVENFDLLRTDERG
jgi:hypothetical protein